MNKALQYMQADMHRAINSGATLMEVSILDLKELLSTVEACEKRQSIEFGGTPLGFCTSHKVRKMLAGKANYIHISRVRTENFDTPVCFTQMLPKPKSSEGQQDG